MCILLSEILDLALPDGRNINFIWITYLSAAFSEDGRCHLAKTKKINAAS